MRLSIITFSYKDPEGLERTLRSLQRLGEYRDFCEILFVDSSPVLNEELVFWAREAFYFRHILMPPEGIYAAMNAGVLASRGDLVWLLQGGDELLDSSVLFSAIDRFQADRNLDILANGVQVIEPGEFHFDYFHHSVLQRNLHGRSKMSTQGVVFRRRVFEQVGCYDTRWGYCADFEFYWKCALYPMKFEASKKILATHRRGGASADWQALFEEFAEIQHELRARLSLRIVFKNDLFLKGNYLRAQAVSWIKRQESLKWLLKWRHQISWFQSP